VPVECHARTYADARGRGLSAALDAAGGGAQVSEEGARVTAANR
jgi:hypothetical protein